MGRISDIFAGRSLDAVLGRIRQRLTAGDFTEAARLVERGLEAYPGVEPLRELRQVVRRAQASAGLSSLKAQVAQDGDPLAHEQLIALYGDVEMPGEARRAAEAYARAHPDRDTPHLLLGELYLQSFFEDLQARDAHTAHDELQRAARLNTAALKPRLLLAELYFCCGADVSLGAMADALERIAPNDRLIQPVLDASRAVRRDRAPESLDALFAQVEVAGALKREPTAWPLRTKRSRDQRLKEDRARAVAEAMVARSEAEEIAIVRRSGTLVAHAGEGVAPVAPGETDAAPPEQGLANVAAGLARGLGDQVRDLDLGAFRRCTLQGPFGVIMVGEVAGTLAAVKHRPGQEPHRVWERLTVALEGGSR